MKKLKPHEVKGELNEQRVMTLTRSLREIVPWILKVKRVGTRLDRAGIDLKVFIESPSGGEDVLALMQVKSSRAQAKLYVRKHSDCIKAGVILIVANDWKSDDHIKTSVLYALEAVRRNPERHVRSRLLHAAARAEIIPTPQHRHRRQKGKGVDDVDEHLFRVRKSCRERSDCELSRSTGRGICE